MGDHVLGGQVAVAQEARGVAAVLAPRFRGADAADHQLAHDASGVEGEGLAVVEADELDHAAVGAHLLGLCEGLHPGAAADAVDDHIRPPGAEPPHRLHRVLARAVDDVVGDASGQPAAALQPVHGHQPSRLPLAHHLQQDAAHQPLAEDDDAVPGPDHGAVGPGQAARGQGQEGGGLEADLVGQGSDGGTGGGRAGLTDDVLGVGRGDDDPVPGAGSSTPGPASATTPAAE